MQVMCCYGYLPLIGVSVKNFISPGENFVSNLKWLNSIKDYGTKASIFHSHWQWNSISWRQVWILSVYPLVLKNVSRHYVLGFGNHYPKKSLPLRFCRAILHLLRAGRCGAQTQELHGTPDARLTCVWRIFQEKSRDFRGWSWQDFTILPSLFIDSQMLKLESSLGQTPHFKRRNSWLKIVLIG